MIITQKNRAIILFVSVLAMSICAPSYFWSIYSYHLVGELSWDSAFLSYTFAAGMGAFPFGTLFFGKIQDSSTPRKVVAISGGAAFLSYVLVAFASTLNAELGLVILTIFYAAGNFFLGGVYNTVLPTVQKWYPDKKGYAAGIAVSASGFGGILFTPILEFALAYTGIFGAFLAQAAITGLFVVVCATIICLPPQDYMAKEQAALAKKSNSAVNYNSKEMLRTPQYFILLVSMSLSCIAYLVISPLLKQLCVDRGLPESIATLAVMSASLMNTLGRFLTSAASDRLGRKITIMFNMLTSAALLLLLVNASSYWVLIITSLLAFTYGGFLSTYPILTSDLFGMKYAGSNYGYVIIASAIASFTSPLIVSATANYGGISTAMMVASGTSVLACIVIFNLRALKTAQSES